MIDVTLLGTAATMPLPERALSSALVSCRGRSVLFDCGEGTQTAARRAGVSLFKTDIIALTHYHGDHIFGLPGLLQTLGCLGREQPLYITGPEGLKEILSPILRLSGPMPFQIYALSAPAGALRLSEILPDWPEEAYLHSFATCHRVPSLGYKLELTRPGKFNPENAKKLGVPVTQWKLLQHGEPVTLPDGKTVRPEQVTGPERRGLSLVFSGDTAPCDSLLAAAEDTDLLICDATYGDDLLADQAGKYGHSTFAESADLARKAGAKRLWLTHFSQMMKDPKEYLPFAAGIYPDAVCGEDGMTLTLRYE